MALKLLQPFVVRPDKNARHDHWQGGAPIHAGATCRQCDQPFQLIWNLNCSDRRFVTKSGRPLFRNISRLPLYWCVPCFESIDYSIVDDQTIELQRVGGKPVDQVKRKCPDPTFPYRNFPREFAKQRISLSTLGELPMTVRRLLTEDPRPKLTESRKAMLEKCVGHSVHPRGFDLMGTWVQLFGGKPYLPQGDDWIVCPNQKCRSHGKRMKVVAAIHNDPPSGLPLIETMETMRKPQRRSFNHFVSVYFHLCNSCNTVHAHSQGS